MFKKLLPLLTLAFVLIATPAVASQNRAPNANLQGDCDEEAEWQNHGAYVSCVAKLHQGGNVTSAAAKSDIGKKHQDEDSDDEEEDASPSPTVEPSASPSPTVEPSASPSPSTSPTPSPTPEAGTEITVNTNVIQALIDQLKDLISSLESLLS